MTDALVIGAGPAGLMAAEALAAAGRQVLVVEAKPSPARKFLMAGKSGLNITHAGPDFAAAYPEQAWLAPMLAEFGPQAVQDWCRDLGQAVFTGSSGRVFPVAMKASPLLRAWLSRLGANGVELRTRWCWDGFDGDAFAFETPAGRQALRPAVTVLALGGASWARLGSDAAWVPWLAARGVQISPFQPANMGFVIDWSAHMARHFGQPVKGAALCLSTGVRERGEFIVSSKGLEGGGIYAISRALRNGATLRLDLLPDQSVEAITARLAKARRGDTVAAKLRKLGLSAVAVALVQEWGRPLPDDLAPLLKALPVPLAGPRPMDEAISTAGGIAQAGLTEGLELRAFPRVFACGEMLDWEAPTGGYLLTACLATGLWAGRAAAKT
ncbi:TIGR03862 family flavoprotein [Pseudorhodobacter sp. E13]|uniref:TIGR03862 family flavoprotein n=1 Tax=Pseudorhodobacter sp. E13 TaxID=2487931 RepID=UPI000F8E640E|nr:TIGR03862 family flavoprotein [Pseudorhodobacter sp. E13]RUS59654.1 TIGR03862 family flavoprotein [Pseudorhodobacter sp. E13]